MSFDYSQSFLQIIWPTYWEILSRYCTIATNPITGCSFSFFAGPALNWWNMISLNVFRVSCKYARLISIHNLRCCLSERQLHQSKFCTFVTPTFQLHKKIRWNCLHIVLCNFHAHFSFFFFSEQKRRLKAEQKAKEKAEKAPPPAEGPKKTKDALSDEDINPNEYFKLRSLAVQQLKSTQISPYPHKYHVNISLQEYIEKYTYLTNGQALEDQTFSVAG